MKLIPVIVVALLVTPIALGSGGKPHKKVTICFEGKTLEVKKKHLKNYEGYVKGECPPEIPYDYPSTGYCVQTTSHGWTFVQAYDGAFAEGQPWYELYVNKATVTIAGQVVTFAGFEPWEPGNGIIPAPIIEGIGLTCDQPWVT